MVNAKILLLFTLLSIISHGESFLAMNTGIAMNALKNQFNPMTVNEQPKLPNIMDQIKMMRLASGIRCLKKCKI